MAHPVFTVAFCTLGRKTVANLISASEHHRCVKEEVADEMNKALKLNPAKDFAAVTSTMVEVAVRSGAFDTATVAYADFRGRYGGIREAVVPAAKAAKKGKKGKKVEAAEAEALAS